mgnify:CR=1 FL=1
MTALASNVVDEGGADAAVALAEQTGALALHAYDLPDVVG